MNLDKLHNKSAKHTSEKRSIFIFESLFLGIFVCLIFVSPKFLYASSMLPPSTLSELIQEGLKNNKELQSLKAQYESYIQEAFYAGSLEDPRIGIGLLNLPVDSFDFNQEPMTQKQIFIAQKVPWFGKLDLQSQRQMLMAVRQEALFKAKQLELSEKIASAYHELGFTEESLEVNQKLASLLDQMLRVAETKYSSGEGLQQDVLQAQVEQSVLIEEKTLLQKQQHVLQDILHQLLNREIFSPVLYSEPLNSAKFDLPLEKIQEQCLKNNPWIQVRKAEVEQAKLNIELARKDYMPNMDFMAAYGQRDEDALGRNLPDFFSVTMTFTIPLWKKKRQDSKLAAEQKEYEVAYNNYQNLVSSLPHQVDALVTEMNETRKNYLFYRDALILQAKQWAASTLSGYEVGKVAFDTMISTQIRLLRLELKARRYMLTLYQKRAELEKLLGGPIEMQSSAHEEKKSPK